MRRQQMREELKRIYADAPNEDLLKQANDLIAASALIERRRS